MRLGPGRPYGPAGLDGIVARIQFGWVHFGIVSTTRFAPSALSSAYNLGPRRDQFEYSLRGFTLWTISTTCLSTFGNTHRVFYYKGTMNGKKTTQYLNRSSIFSLTSKFQLLHPLIQKRYVTERLPGMSLWSKNVT